ncbi:MAG: flavodoxin-dependent (E)-4-hydroxy-3-methylbut-2-enyl-diphosphate synthase [Desulfohalobiaceae bacterium]
MERTANPPQTMPRARKSKTIFLGGVGIGGSQPVRVQSMTNTDTRNPKATLRQIQALARAGCEIVRVAVPDQVAVDAIRWLKTKKIPPLVADIHFDHRLALASIEAGVDGLRINPGNIGSARKIAQVVDAAQKQAIPIRIGVNSGSVEKDLLRKHHGPTPEAMLHSALRQIRLLEERNFQLIKISLKSSSVLNTLQAYQLLAQHTDYPLHIGITEAGTLLRGTVKSSVGLGLLLFQGLGDTIRVSLTGKPQDEVLVAWEILRSLGLRSRGPEIISCPTCGRTEIDLIQLTRAVERYLQPVQEVFTVAVMGCAVNGPGEAKEADIGLAGGRGMGVIFRKGKVIKKVLANRLLQDFKAELDSFILELRKQQDLHQCKNRET